MTWQILTQNSSSSVRCSTFVIFLILLLAKSRVDIFGQFSKPSMQANPFSDKYSCSNLFSSDKFVIDTILLLWRLSKVRFFNLLRFWIFDILFLPKNSSDKLSNPSKFSISRILLSPNSSIVKFFRCATFSIFVILFEEINNFCKLNKFPKPSIFFIRLNDKSSTLKKTSVWLILI